MMLQMGVQMSGHDVCLVAVDRDGSRLEDDQDIPPNCRQDGLSNDAHHARENNPLGNHELVQMEDDPCVFWGEEEKLGVDMEGLASSSVVEVVESLVL